jgi:2,4-diketo-3-deoxy-L-fuconate hydrolase
MKLIRFGELGREAPGLLLDNEKRLDISHLSGNDQGFFEDGGLSRLKEWLKDNAAFAPRVARSVRLGSPISRPSKIVCIGLNFRDHAKESEMEIPKEPVIFFKATTSLVGPNDNLIMPKNARKVDWEVELALVIGNKSNYIEREDALEHVAGYALHNDYSERVFQLERGGQWVKGKSVDTLRRWGRSLRHAMRFRRRAGWECG